MNNQVATQSLNGLQTTTLFQASTAGDYLINGQLQIPMTPLINSSAGESQVQSLVFRATSAYPSNTSSTALYSGALGASGFQLIANLGQGDIAYVVLQSSATIDQGLNQVRGVVGVSSAP